MGYTSKHKEAVRKGKILRAMFWINNRLGKIKQFKPSNRHSIKLMMVWVMAFAAIGVTALLMTRAATPTVDYSSIAPSNFCPDGEAYNRMKQIWATTQYSYNKSFAASPAGADWANSAGYYVPEFTNTTLEAAIGCGDTQLISELADVYLNAAGSRVDDTRNGITRKYWLNDTQGEQYTSSQQWFYALTRILTVIAATPASQRTERMNTFVSTYKSDIAGYYKCWIWKGCYESTARNAPLSSLVNEMYANVNSKTTNKYALDDRHQWPIAAMAQLYLAYKNDPSLIDLTGNNYTITEAQIVQFVKDSARLAQQRSVPVSLNNKQGQTVTGYNFDPGFWRVPSGLVDMQYSGYSGACYPIIEAVNLPKANALAIELSNGQTTSCHTGYYMPIPEDDSTAVDIGHAWRLPFMYVSLYSAYKAGVGTGFPTYEDMQKVANQVAYGVTDNSTPNYPKYRNYWSGSNGWYRLGYGGKAGFGYAPWQLGQAVITQGFGILSGFNSDLRDNMRRTRDIAASSDPTDVAFAKKYYSSNDVYDFIASYKADYSSNLNTKYWFYMLSAIPPAGFTYVPNGSSQTCPAGQTGTPPNCVTPPPTTCPSGQTGTPPNCVDIVVIPTLGANCVRYEAETLTLGGPTSSTYNTGYSGAGYVENFGPEGNYIQFDRTITNSGNYALTIRYGAGAGDSVRDIYVDGVKVLSMALPTTSAFASWSTAASTNIHLSAGAHIIKIAVAAGSKYANVDYVDLCLVSADPSPVASTPLTKKCDINNDTHIDSKDLSILLANYNKTVTINTKGDCNSDTKVDSKDLFILLGGWGK